MAFLNYAGLQRFLGKLKTIFVGDLAYDANGKALQKVVNGTASDVLSVATIKRDLHLSKSDIGLDDVENKTSEEIRQEITKKNVTDALGIDEGTVRFLREDGAWGTPLSSVNGVEADPDGNAEIVKVPFAENLTADDAQSSAGEFIARATGGETPVADGPAWLAELKGRRIHSGYTPASVVMTVTPATRVAPADITATINETAFKTAVENTFGNYRFFYNGYSWALPDGEMGTEVVDIADYGITVTNTPIADDNIYVVYHEIPDPEDPEDTVEEVLLTVNPAVRYADPAITAMIDNEAFIEAAGDNSGTYTFTYTTAWSTDPATYGITVHHTPKNGDVITVVYAAENRGTITMANPTSFISTGWNLYNHTAGYARVVKYSEQYGFKIGGTYTALQFSETLDGAKTTITPDANGLFTIAKDGYVWVTGGNTTDTYIIMTGSDWTGGYAGTFAAYEESVINLASVMSNFPYGLCHVKGISDEIDFEMKTAIRYIDRMAYSAANLATAKASGRDYEYDTNYIYFVLETPVHYALNLSDEYTAHNHGMEIIGGTTVAVLMEALYGQNLKEKLRTDVATLSPQTLTSAQKTQVRTNIGAASQAGLDAANTAIESLVQESAFRIVLDGDTYYLDWYGAQGACPYAITQEGTDYVLNFVYTY